MDQRWPAPEPERARRVESDSASEILALAQRLQAEASDLLSEEQVIEMGRELGLEPRHVREAIRLRRPVARVSPPPAAPAGVGMHGGPLLAPEEAGEPLAAIGRALAVLFGLAMAPLAIASGGGNLTPIPFLALTAAIVVGWVARYPRLAGLAGALTAPMALLIGFFYIAASSWIPGLGFAAIFHTLLAFCPLCWATARGAAAIRRWAEQQGDGREWSATDR